MFSHDIGIDLGTANTLIYMKHKGIVLREPSAVAVNVRNGSILAVGKEAKQMIGFTPSSVSVIRPLKDGVIADFDITATMLKQFIKRTISGRFSKPRIIICIPSGVTEVERRAVVEASYQAGAKSVQLIEEPMAAAIGAGLPVEEATGSMVVDIGGGTTEVAIISLGGIVTSRSVRVAGDKFDEDIIEYIKKKHNILIGERTSEKIKITLGSVINDNDEEVIEIRGKNLQGGLPKNFKISAQEIREALTDSISLIIEAIHSTLDRTPPELSADIIDRGITLTGGGALLRGLDRLIANETGITVNVSENPLDCVAEGTGRILEDSNGELSKVLSGS